MTKSTGPDIGIVKNAMIGPTVGDHYRTARRLLATTRTDDRRDYRPRDSYNRDRAPPASSEDAEQKRKAQEEERQRKLAEMQSNASEMEDARRQRIAEVTALEEKQLEEDEKHRSDKGRFVGGLHRQLQEDGLDDRIKRSRGGLARLDED
ncbi:U2-type spliceosomal complex subunit CWC25 [Aspergillus ibericus CBS 121593]|uniref:Uncharacterized protein n=1 Tax=Aspergillus ibericus CBS 121593 TaxID=1448316 RepID=A0A395GWJ0_9EURO|nr:hypothetical protein BO80DRAFT_446066 [Aspergillus ibericus CBS 121593]RAK99729.1 hypothetical protein BO80DRAFT_446066 [Aspergillus ibericus CBS 121593]